MIRIEEKQTVKVPGVTSLFVSFDYKKEVVDEIKALEGTQYNAESKVWECPISILAELLDKCCKYDEFTLSLLPDKLEFEEHVDVSNFRTKPFEYQQVGIEFGLTHNCFLLLDAPGLGKTLQLTYLAEELQKRENLQHCLIICGINTLKTNWKTEIEKHSRLSCRILGQRVNRKGQLVVDGIDKRLEQLLNPIEEFFVITNVETLRNEKILAALKKNKYNKFDMVVIDEIHKCLDGNSFIDTDQGIVPIKDIVNNKLCCKVKSYNTLTNSVCMSPVLNWYKHGCVTSMLQLTFEDESGKQHVLRCTEDHMIYTENRGFVEARDLTQEDIVNIGTQ